MTDLNPYTCCGLPLYAERPWAKDDKPLKGRLVCLRCGLLILRTGHINRVDESMLNDWRSHAKEYKYKYLDEIDE
jgi:hypothetical protein